MRIARASATDAPRLAAILRGWLRETPWMPEVHDPSEDAPFVARLIARGDVTVLRGWRGVHGFLARDGAVIHALYLAPQARGRGFGTRLLARAKAVRPRLELWCFQANMDARRFYAREGFAEVERTDGAGNDEGLPDIRLVWEREAK